MSETEEEITALLARLDASWSQRDFDDILALWDREETDPIYVAEEADTKRDRCSFAHAHVDHSAAAPISDARKTRGAPPMLVALIVMSCDT